MALYGRVSIARRFLRSIRVDSDLCETAALDGFVCTPSTADVLFQMARHVLESGQGAFTWTGPYGSGKSSLAVVLAALMSYRPELQDKAEKAFGRKLSNTLRTAFPTGPKGRRVLAVVGRRENPCAVLGEAVKRAGLVSRRPRGGWNDENLVAALVEAAAEKPKSHGGLIVIIDEMGKFLESAAHDGSDVFVFQQLAEAASRSNGRLLVIGVLHQAFDEYAHRLSHELRDEWSKIQGRFVDLVVDTAGEEQIELISRAIETEPCPKKYKSLAAEIAAVVRRERVSGTALLATVLEGCWPLHPAVACLLGPISRRRFGQNQRSIFGFLNSSEVYGFQDFLKRAADDELYGPDLLWDYLRANLEPSILASPDGHRWATAAEALDRCEAIGADEIHIKLLKAIAAIDLFRDRSGLVASFDLLGSCFPDTPAKSLQDALSQLDSWSLTIFKKFLDAHAIFAGSDFDIDRAVRSALNEIEQVDISSLKSLAGLQPVLAKRHYHETGAMRWFDVSIVPLSEFLAIGADRTPAKGAIGEFLLAIPTNDESSEYARDMCRRAARNSGEWDVVVGLSNRSWVIVPLARELFALDRVNNDHPELAGDAVARREVFARLATLQGRLETELQKAFDDAMWFRKNHSPKRMRYAELNVAASDLADRRYCAAPRIHSELLNRQKPSSSAVAAQNALLRKMVLHEGEPRLGIEGFPAEGGLFASLLEMTGLYRKERRINCFASLSRSRQDPCGLAPMWDAALSHVKVHSDRTIAISELFDLWRSPPYGVKDGLMPILAVAFVLSNRDVLAIYRDGIFRAKFDDVDADYLAKDSTSIQLRWMDLTEMSRKLLSEMAQVVRRLDARNDLVHLEPIDVARGLVSIFDQLPQWTKRTTRLSSNAVHVRDIFKRAHDPNKFLFDDIPKTFRQDGAEAGGDQLQRIASNVGSGLQELVDAYPNMLHRLRDMMLAELQVPNLSPQSLLELRERAENIRQLAGDFRLDAFVSRLTCFDEEDESFEGIASLTANKPPRDWVDPDLDAAAMEVTDLAQRFLRAETFARVKGRPQKRHSMAVVIGTNGRPTPLLKEFDIAESDRGAVEELINRVSEALAGADTAERGIILAALAEVSSRYMSRLADERKTNAGTITS